jgi:hypothetical protein
MRMSILAITDSAAPMLAQAGSQAAPADSAKQPQVKGPFAGPPVVNMHPAAKEHGPTPPNKTPQAEPIRASVLQRDPDPFFGTEGAIQKVLGAEEVYKKTGNPVKFAQLFSDAFEELVAAVDRELATYIRAANIGPNASPDDLEQACKTLLADHAYWDPNANRIVGEAFGPIIIRRLANRPDPLAAATADFDRASKRLDDAFTSDDIMMFGRTERYVKQLQQAAAVRQVVWLEASRKADQGTDTKLQAECKHGLEGAEADVKRVNSRFFVETHSNYQYRIGLAANLEYNNKVTWNNLVDSSSAEIAHQRYRAWHTALLNAEEIGDPEYIEACRLQYNNAEMWDVRE